MRDSKLPINTAAHRIRQFRPFAGRLVLSVLTLGLVPHVVAEAIPTAGSHSTAEQVSAQHSSKIPARLSSYYSTLQNHEAEGPYHRNSSEVLYSLGLALQKNGQHGKALKALRRAMHINRVNDGLNSLSQAPMLRSIINSQKSLVQFEPVTANYHQLLRLHTKTYGDQDPRLIPLLHELGQWHIDAYQFDERESRIDHLTSAYSLAMSALQLNQTAPVIDQSQQIELLRNAALINFFLSRHEEDKWSSSLDSQYSFSSEKLSTSIPQRTATLSGTSFRRGRICHERIIEILEADPNASSTAKIKAHTELADWYLLFNHRNNAMQRYRHALALIDNSEQPETLHKELFLTPHLLPAKRMENFQGNSASFFMNLELGISKKGWGENLESIEDEDNAFPGLDQPSNRGLRRMIRQTIKRTRFRPRFVDNNPVDVSRIVVKIPLIH